MINSYQFIQWHQRFEEIYIYLYFGRNLKTIEFNYVSYEYFIKMLNWDIEFEMERIVWTRPATKTHPTQSQTRYKMYKREVASVEICLSSLIHSSLLFNTRAPFLQKVKIKEFSSRDHEVSILYSNHSSLNCET